MNLKSYDCAGSNNPTCKIWPSCNAPLGAEIRGIDLSLPLAATDVEAIEEAWRIRLVVVIRGQKLSDPQLLAFSRCFG